LLSNKKKKERKRDGAIRIIREKKKKRGGGTRIVKEKSQLQELISSYSWVSGPNHD
jgi:hypothetical protein